MPPEGSEFVCEAAKRALDEQSAWIGDLDTKAGVLLGAVAVLFGLLLLRILCYSRDLPCCLPWSPFF
jgi:hypothetical protein